MLSKTYFNKFVIIESYRRLISRNRFFRQKMHQILFYEKQSGIIYATFQLLRIGMKTVKKHSFSAKWKTNEKGAKI